MMENRSNKIFSQVSSLRNIKRKQRRYPTACKICGAFALYSSYGVIVCDPCRKFFRRNGEQNQKQIQCNSDGHCEINIYNRHMCASCRLAKCFESGMQIEMFRCSRIIKNHTTRKQKAMTIPSTVLVSLENKNQLQQSTTLNLLRSDPSKLTIDQWNLFSNPIYCYDKYDDFLFVQRFIKEQNQLPPKMRFKLSLVEKLLQMISKTNQY